MNHKALRVLALVLAAALLLAGCELPDLLLPTAPDESAPFEVVAFSDMTYTRPDVDALVALQERCDDAKLTDADALMERVYALLDAYDAFYTSYNLAYVHYCQDLTDSYWSAEYRFCADNSATVDAALDALYYALAASPCREELESERYFGADFFDDYEGESIWDEGFLNLMDRETALVNEYYDLSARAAEEQPYFPLYDTDYGDRAEQIFAELVVLRQEIAQYTGYDSYPAFAYDFYYGRDYSPQQSLTYVERIRQELVPLYQEAASSDVWYIGAYSSTEKQTFRYVKTCAQAMGGIVEEAFELLEEAELYDLAYSSNKYNSSFELYMSSYGEPFVFLNPEHTVYDRLTFAHEFGHFANDYACGGSYAGIDVAEVFSQAMEYLSLCYGEDTENLERLKMADCLCTYVEQAAYADFEHRVYALSGDEITPENIRTIYADVCADFSLDVWGVDARGYTTVGHFYTSPMYVISYVVSNDVAFQIYQLERARSGEGLTLYEGALASEDSCLLAFAETIGLESPFADGRLEAVRRTISEIL